MPDFKYLHEIYAKPIDRNFNPAVNASDFKEETVNVEIDEYVFTDEIINNIHQVLTAIRDRRTDHNGIWINGYFGSGKSHFLKYLDYCLHPKYSERAVAKLAEAVEQRDPLQVPESRCEVTLDEVHQLKDWLRTAHVETTLFNIGSVANSNTNQQRVFTEVFWHELNRHRGYNTFNLPLAQYFEKVLDEKGKFDEFKTRLEEEYGFDWATQAADLANTEIDLVLDLAKEIVPTLSTDIIRERVVKNDFVLTVEAFMKELHEFVAGKPDNFRFIFFADEISQFIDNRSALLLQLQQLVSDLHEACDGKVWIACTAQQDLSEILGDCHINRTTDDYGKIMGRFQVKVSLKGTNSEYITQKRILDKTGAAAIMLENRYEQIRSNIAAQLLLPTGYNIFRDKHEFAAYYPFVPYQFTLMQNIFDAFVGQSYVDKEVKGNERSIIKITHSVAKDTMNQEVGNLISFDQFYNAMFRGSLTAKGQKAIATANNVIESYHDRKLGERVVNVLFMICNMDEQQRRVFPATADLITTLLMRNVDEKKLTLKNEVQGVLDYLCEHNILRRDTLTDGATEFYTFFTEEERRVASSINNQYVDNDFMSSLLIDLFKEVLAPSNRESYHTSKFSIGGTVNGKTFLSSNADIVVDFIIEADCNKDGYTMRNPAHHLAFFMADLYAAEPQLRDKLTWICKVRKYVQSPDGQSSTEARRHAIDKFKAMATEEYKKTIEPAFRRFFNEAPILSGTQTLTVAASTKDKDRYNEALRRHLDATYPYASVVDSPNVPRSESDLRAKILRETDANEYAGEAKTLTEPEIQIENYITRRGGEANLKDLVAAFAGIPYGWSQEATLYFANELVRRNAREFTYNNAENPGRQAVANNIMRDTAKFMLKSTKDIPQSVVNAFLEAWRDIFGDNSVPRATHPAEIHAQTRELLNHKITNEQTLMARLERYPVGRRLQPVIDLCKAWYDVRDDQQFFERVAADAEQGKRLMDDAKQIRDFAGERTFTAYRQFMAFVDDNRDNWEYLPESCRNEVEGIKAIKTEEWPIDKLRYYKQMQATLNTELNNVREALRKKIKDRLYAENDQIVSFAAESSVDYTPVVESVVTRMTASSNISTLRANELDNSWYTGEINKINAEIERRKTGHNPTDPDTTHAPSKRVGKVRLNTPTMRNLKDAQDVEAYLERLRQQLLSKLADNDEIQVL